MAGVPRGRARGGRLLTQLPGFMICFFFLQSSEPLLFLLGSLTMLTIPRKRNKIVSAVSLRLALARPRADRPPPLLSSARPPSSLARLVCYARPPGSSARLLACKFPISCALVRRLINLAYCITLSLWHSAHFLGNGSCATTLYPTYPTYPTPCPLLFSSIVAKFIL